MHDAVSCKIDTATAASWRNQLVYYLYDQTSNLAKLNIALACSLLTAPDLPKILRASSVFIITLPVAAFGIVLLSRLDYAV
jgi:hypothetical protein